LLFSAEEKQVVAEQMEELRKRAKQPIPDLDWGTSE
jgi:hypothetical protein